MDKYVIGAIIALIGVVISNIVLFSNQRKILKDNKNGRDEVRSLSKEINYLEANQAERLSEINNNLDNLSYVFKANHLKSREVLNEFYSRVAEIRLILESYVVPLFDYSETEKMETITQASKKFEELYRYIQINLIHVKDSGYYMRELGEVMALINRMKNIAVDKNLGSRDDQIESIQTGINPIIARIEEKVKQDLNIL